MGYKLSILIATVTGREHFFNPLVDEFNSQIREFGYENDIEIVSKSDNKEMSIGTKRQWLMDNSTGEYLVYFDDDDFPFKMYCYEMMEAIKQNPDCVGFIIYMTTNGMSAKRCCHSLKYKETGWQTNLDGYDYVRNVTHFNPVKRSLAEIIRFQDMRFGEDKEYSDKVTQLCKTEIFIPRMLFHYRYSNTMQHNQKYGIK